MKPRDDKEFARMQDAILIVLYESHPVAMHKDDIQKIIAERNLLHMTDEEFQEYKKKIITSKRN